MHSNFLLIFSHSIPGILPYFLLYQTDKPYTFVDFASFLKTAVQDFRKGVNLFNHINMHISTLRIWKAGRTIFLLALFFAFSALTSLAQSLDFKSTSLTITARQLERIFASKAGDQLELALVNDRKQNIKCQASVMNHINEGPTTGVLRLTITSASGKANFLLNRKQVKGKLIYMLNLMLPGTSEAYRLDYQSEDSFVLVKTSKDKIVSE
jgi:hypothetical protein